MKIINLIGFLFIISQTAPGFAQEGAVPVLKAEDLAPIQVDNSALTKSLSDMPSVKSVVTSEYGSSMTGQVVKAITSCQSSSSTAKTSCLTELNPKIQAASGMIGLLLSGIGSMTSTADSCGKYNKALKLAETALTTYNGMCSAGQLSCVSSCENGTADLEGVIKAIRGKIEADNLALAKASEAVPANAALVAKLKADIAAEQNDIVSLNKEETDLSSKLRTCQGYKMNLAAASVGLMNVVKQSGMASTCQAQIGTDCTKDPNNVACKAASLDCTKAENSSNTQCICLANPTSPGCAGYTGQSTAFPTATRGADPTAKDASVGTPNLSGVDSGVTAGAVGGGSAGGSSGLGGTGGGGGGGLGGGGTNANAKSGADGKSQKASANILSGYEGGGGGGGRSGGGRGDYDSAYKAYMPGGAKDPSRGIASKTFGNGEVTAAGSKSNWEKVSERYMDNKPTLMGP
jgi:hypothetical protein